MTNYRATMSWFNGKYWSHPDHVERINASTLEAACGAAGRAAKKNLIPKGCRTAKKLKLTLEVLSPVKLPEE